MNKRFWIGFVVVSLIILGIYNINFFENKNYQQEIDKVYLDDGICENLSMKDTAFCLNNFVKNIYQYKITPDHTILSFEQLKKDGGDCLDWTRFYKKHIERLGFYVETPIIDLGKNSHIFVIISDETGYCSLDQKSIYCFMFKQE